MANLNATQLIFDPKTMLLNKKINIYNKCDKTGSAGNNKLLVTLKSDKSTEKCGGFRFKCFRHAFLRNLMLIGLVVLIMVLFGASVLITVLAAILGFGFLVIHAYRIINEHGHHNTRWH